MFLFLPCHLLQLLSGLNDASRLITSSSSLFRETIILESEGSSSGTETTTTVTFRLGGTSAGTTSVKQSQTKIKSHKIALMEELAESSVASR